MRRTDHIVDRYGLVGCPNRGDVVAVDCPACAGFDSVHVDAGLEVITCRPDAVRIPQRTHRSRSEWIRFLTPAG